MNTSHRWKLVLLRVFGLWLAGAIIFGALGFEISSIRLFYCLKRDGIKTTGTVTGLQPANHQAVYYSFDVRGRAYSNIGRSGFGNPEFRFLTVGQSVIVYYSPDDPSTSCVGEPQLLLNNEVVPVVLAGIIFPIFLIAVNGSRFPKFQRWLLYQTDTQHDLSSR